MTKMTAIPILTSMPPRRGFTRLFLGFFGVALATATARALPDCPRAAVVTFGKEELGTGNMSKEVGSHGYFRKPDGKGGFNYFECIVPLVVTVKRKPRPPIPVPGMPDSVAQELRRQQEEYQAYLRSQQDAKPDDTKTEGPPITQADMNDRIAANGGATVLYPSGNGGAEMNSLPITGDTARGLGFSNLSSGDAARDAAATKAAADAAARASKSAAGLAGGINVDKGDAGPLGPRGKDAKSAEAAKGGGAPSPELLAAQNSGITAPFSAMGLKVAPDGSVRRKDGSPAGADEVAELQRRVRGEPLAPAATGDKDFFNKIPRDKYENLKTGIKDPALQNGIMKDVGTTERDRDFKWKRTCNSQLEPDCNKNEPTGRYINGKYVSAEALAKMAEEALKKEEEEKKNGVDKTKAAADFWAKLEKEDKEYREKQAKQAAPPAPKGFGGRLAAMLASISKAMGFGGEMRDDEGRAVGASAAAGAGEKYIGPNGLEMSPPSKLPSDVALLKNMPPLAAEPPQEPASPRRGILYALLGVLALMIVVFAWKRRPRGV